MPTSAHSQLPAIILSYYRGVETTLLTHLQDREVIGFGRDAAEEPAMSATVHDVRLHIADIEDLDEAVRSGIVGFRLPGLTASGMVGLRITPGEGSGMDTVATTALALAQSMARDGLATTALTDGIDGLYLIAFGVGQSSQQSNAGRYATALAVSAPEIATTSPDDSDGRALIGPLTQSTTAVPAPYSLVPVAGRVGVIAPLTLDEVAAASAGMPLEIDPHDLADRISDYGDLAAALSEATDRLA